MHEKPVERQIEREVYLLKERTFHRERKRARGVFGYLCVCLLVRLLEKKI